MTIEERWITPMATVTLHEVDEEVLRRLEVERPLSPSERLAIAQRIAAMTPRGVGQTDSVELLRRDRDR